MKREFLQELKLDKETIDKVMSEHGKSIESYKGQVGELTAERDSLQAGLADVDAKLKAFDGVDVNALKGEIETLKGDIAKMGSEHKEQIAERDFQAILAEEITAAKGKNAKAIAANLDLEKLKTSKNQKSDIAAAIKAVAESDAYLFGEDSKPKKPVIKTDSGNNQQSQTDDKDAAFASLAAELIGGN